MNDGSLRPAQQSIYELNARPEVLPHIPAGVRSVLDVGCGRGGLGTDVLEHMVDPWQVLRDTREWLSPSGHLLACIPNIQYWPAVIDLVNGRWDYADTGLMDRTHLRFFTRKTMCDMIESAGYEVVGCHGANSVWGSEWRPAGRGLRRKMRNVCRGMLTRARPDGEFLHFVVLARPIRPAQT